MAGSSPYGDSGEDAEADLGSGSPPSAPRWVKVSAIVAVILILLIGALALFGGGQHGPDRHTSSGAGGAVPSPTVSQGQTPPGSGFARHAAPEGGHR